MSNSGSVAIRKVAVLGAGVMGAQIAAHLVNANIATVLFDLPSKEGDPSAIAKKAIKGLAKLKPAPLATNDRAAYIHPANYDTDLELLQDCDLIIEAIAERLDWKEDLYKKIAPHVGANTVLASNTSGLSVNTLAGVLPAELQDRFCGMHFFNPPRYMRLVELIPTAQTNKDLLPELETFLTSVLGKGVIYAKDTPNFIANRVGVFSILATFAHTEQFNIPFEVVDALTGPIIGRAKSATFRTVDVVGLDTMAHVIHTMDEHLADDPWHEFYKSPQWLAQLIDKGALGQKTRCGIYKKEGKTINVLDLEQGNYRPATEKADDEVLAILKTKDAAERFSKLRSCEHPQAQFMWACYRDVFHYIAVHLESIADNARDVDLAIRWGFGWQQGPFEIWQSAGWEAITSALQEEISAGKTMANVELPAWVTTKANDGVYQEAGAFNPASEQFIPRSDLPVYKRQIFPDAVLGEQFDQGQTVLETDAVRLWTQGDDIGILTFKSKMNAVGSDVLEGIQASLDKVEDEFKAMVIWQCDPRAFSAGANLKEFGGLMLANKTQQVVDTVHRFQQACMGLRYASVPVVAALQGLALGGGCELLLHCDRIVGALESYVGLVEVGVGLLPAGGGTKEFALRAANDANDSFDLLGNVQRYYEHIAMAKVSASSLDAQQMGVLREADITLFHPAELLYVAKQQAGALAESCYRPAPKAQFAVAGKDGIARLKALLVNYHEGGFISDYDYEICSMIAEVICGGDIETGSIVDEEWLLKLEREYFGQLSANKKTHERIEHMLKTGKPLRN